MSTPEDKKQQKADNVYMKTLSAMATKKPRLTIYLSPDQKQYLEEWAEEDRRTLTNLVGMLIDKAIEERQKSKEKKN